MGHFLGGVCHNLRHNENQLLALSGQKGESRASVLNAWMGRASAAWDPSYEVPSRKRGFDEREEGGQTTLRVALPALLVVGE